MELPAYHLPTVGSVLRSMWERGWSFIKKAGTVILLSTIVIWFLQGFGFENGAFGMVADVNNSLLAAIGGGIAWIFIPLGFGFWQAAVATVSGLVAKENLVATFGIIYGFAEVAENGEEIWGLLAQALTPQAAFALLTFNLLCAPCFAAMGAIKREMNNAGWFWFAIGYQCIFAYCVSLCVYQVWNLIVTGSFSFFTVVAFALIALFIYLLFRPYRESETLNMKIRAGKAGA